MVREAVKVAAASMVVAAFCLVTVAQADDNSGDRTCRYCLGVGEDRTVTSHTGTSGRRFPPRCTRYRFTCDGGYLVLSFEETMECRNGALVVTYDGRNVRVCGPFSSDIVTSGSTLVVSVDSSGGLGGGGFGGGRSYGEHGGKTFFRGQSSGGQGSGGHGSGGHGSGGHGSGGHGSGGHGSGGHCGSSEEGDDYEFNVLCTTDTTPTSTITATDTTPTFPITDTTTTSTTTSTSTTT